VIFYKDNHVTLYCMDFRKNDLPEECVQCVVTSPPYWGLRKYSGEQDLVWGDNHCEHQWITETRSGMTGGTNCKAIGGWAGGSVGQNTTFRQIQTNTCSLCGAWKGAYGLEPTPEMYIQHTIEILREIKRVLRKDGVVFWNIGDSYSGSWGNRSHRPETKRLNKFEVMHPDITPPTAFKHSTIKPKDLCLIPFRVAIAAQEDGWWVRSIIIWSKPNPMPESVTDRPTESHEYILMLTKSARYYWDADAVREPQDITSLLRLQRKHSGYDPGYPGGPQNHISNYFKKQEGKSLEEITESVGGRNIRTVWEFPTQPFPQAHFAVFPEKLPELCIKAASKPNDLVLDPFSGVGTTLWVAKKLNRWAVGYEISEEYCNFTVDRLRQQVLL